MRTRDKGIESSRRTHTVNCHFIANQHPARCVSRLLANAALVVISARSAAGADAGTILYDLSSRLGMDEPGLVFIYFGAIYALGYSAGSLKLRSR